MACFEYNNSDCETKSNKNIIFVSQGGYMEERIESVVREEVEDKAVEILLYIMKKQVFIDGNKRTAVIFANHYLISKGNGIIVIPAEFVEEYKRLLILYYEGNDENQIKTFLKEKCYMRI